MIKPWNLVKKIYNKDEESLKKVSSSLKKFPDNKSHRLLQQKEKDEFTGNTVYKAHIHRGILNDLFTDTEKDLVFPTTAMVELMFNVLLKESGRFNKSKLSLNKDTNNDDVLLLSDFQLIKKLVLCDVRENKNNLFFIEPTVIKCIIDDNGLISLLHEISKIESILIASASVCSIKQMKKRKINSDDFSKGTSMESFYSDLTDFEDSDTISNVPLSSDEERDIKIVQIPNKNNINLNLTVDLKLIDSTNQYLLPIHLLNNCLSQVFENSHIKGSAQDLTKISEFWINPVADNIIASTKTENLIIQVESTNGKDKTLIITLVQKPSSTQLNPTEILLKTTISLTNCFAIPSTTQQKLQNPSPPTQKKCKNPSFTPVEVKTELRRIVSEAYPDDPVSDYTPLMEIGLDSLEAPALAAQFSQSFRLRLPATLLYDYPTIEDLSSFIESHVCGEKEVVSAAEVKEGLPLEMSLQDTRELQLVGITGIALSFPGGCVSMSEFRNLLVEKKCTAVMTPLERWNIEQLLKFQRNHGRINEDQLRSRLSFAHYLTKEQLSSTDESQYEGKENGAIPDFVFDPSSFGITAKEAAVMHPSHKLLLTNCRRAFKDAGYEEISSIPRNTGVFVGIGGVMPGSGINPSLIDLNCFGPISAYEVTGTATSIAAGRISYHFNLNGPCMVVDSACSSSLAALHLTRRSLQLNECDLAVVAGVNVLDAYSMLSCAAAKMTSLDGICHTFDSSANGYARGEGCGMLILKRVSDCQQQQKLLEQSEKFLEQTVGSRNKVYAVVRGSAVRQDGKSQGLTAPLGPAQERVIRDALADAQLEPSDVLAVEAHGTGTPLGDPIETGVLAKVYGGKSEDLTLDPSVPPSVPHRDPCFISSVKANIGHLEEAAGVSGLFSALLTVGTGLVPPNAQLKEMNEKVKQVIEGSSLVFPREPHFLRTEDKTLDPQSIIVGISSFGYGGTIAHVLLEEPPAGLKKALISPLEAILENEGLSMSSTSSTSEIQEEGSLRGSLEEEDDEEVSLEGKEDELSFCSEDFSLEDSFDDNSLLSDEDQFYSEMGFDQGFQDFELDSDVGFEEDDTRDEELMWQFSGQGSLGVGVGKNLFETNPVFRESLEECDQYLKEFLAFSVINLLYPEVNNLVTKKKASDLLQETAIAQPVLVALEYALAKVSLSSGEKPSIFLGHSLGEYTAVVIAGIVSLKDMLKLACVRGRIVQDTAACQGCMMALKNVSIEDVSTWLGKMKLGSVVSLAAINGSDNLVISGHKTDVESLFSTLKNEKTSENKKTVLGMGLSVKHGFHSPLMDHAVIAFEKELNEVFSQPLYEEMRNKMKNERFGKWSRIHFISTVRGSEIKLNELLTAKYWVDHMKLPVLYDSAIKTSFSGFSIKTLVEMGPKNVLTNLAKGIIGKEADIKFVTAIDY